MCDHVCTPDVYKHCHTWKTKINGTVHSITHKNPKDLCYHLNKQCADYYQIHDKQHHKITFPGKKDIENCQEIGWNLKLHLSMYICTLR